MHIYCTRTHTQILFHYSRSVSCSYCICYICSMPCFFFFISSSSFGPFRAIPLGLKNYFLEAMPCLGNFISFFFFPCFCFLRAKVHGTADHCTITRRSQCLTPHHLETVARSLTRESNCSSITYVKSAAGQDGSFLHVWFGTSPFHICALHTVLEDFEGPYWWFCVI